MSGRLGRSGRRPRFPLTAQFPPAPHVANWEGILPGAAKPSTVKPPDIWEPTADDLAGLGNAGRTFLMRLHSQRIESRARRAVARGRACGRRVGDLAAAGVDEVGGQPDCACR